MARGHIRKTTSHDSRPVPPRTVDSLLSYIYIEYLQIGKVLKSICKSESSPKQSSSGFSSSFPTIERSTPRRKPRACFSLAMVSSGNDRSPKLGVVGLLIGEKILKNSEKWSWRSDGKYRRNKHNDDSRGHIGC